MSDTSAFGFGQFVPGFDFLQNLSKTAAQAAPTSGAVPGMSSWVAPTLSVEEIDKRIQELKSVLFWLEQNTKADIASTIMRLRCTLSTIWPATKENPMCGITSASPIEPSSSLLPVF